MPISIKPEPEGLPDWLDRWASPVIAGVKMNLALLTEAQFTALPPSAEVCDLTGVLRKKGDPALDTETRIGGRMAFGTTSALEQPKDKPKKKGKTPQI